MLNLRFNSLGCKIQLLDQCCFPLAQCIFGIKVLIFSLLSYSGVPLVHKIGFVFLMLVRLIDFLCLILKEADFEIRVLLLQIESISLSCFSS